MVVEYSIQQADGFDRRLVSCETPQDARFLFWAIANEMRRLRLGGYVKVVINGEELFMHLEPRVVVKMVVKSRVLSANELAAMNTQEAPPLRVVNAAHDGGGDDIVLEDDVK